VQLVELQEAWRSLQNSGVALFAISYDSVDVLAAFAEKRGISFPLLSDEGSRTIRALGLLNEHLPEQHAFYGIQTRDEQLGVAYPGIFVLDENGLITEKHFEQSYRVRPTARIFEEYALGTSAASAPVDGTSVTNDRLQVRAWTDAPTYRPYQMLRLHVELSVPPEMHVFAAPVPDGYAPLSLQIEPLDGLQVDPYQLQTPRPFTVDGLEEEFFVYEGVIQAVIPLQLTKNLGPTSLTLRVSYQACTPTECFPPASLRVDVPLNGLDLIRD
jgi:peroxiredoxin